MKPCILADAGTRLLCSIRWNPGGQAQRTVQIADPVCGEV